MRRIALCGNPNSGKTTLFNALTGLNLHTGNYNGVTVSSYEAELTKDVILCDLPGIFTSSPDTPDESATCEYIKNYATEAIIITDGTALEKAVPLITAVSEQRIPSIMIITMADIMRRDGISVDSDKLSRILGIPVIISERRGINKIKEFITSANYCQINQAVTNKLSEIFHSVLSGGKSQNLCLFDKYLFSSHIWFLMPAVIILPLILIYGYISPLFSIIFSNFTDALQSILYENFGGMPYFFKLYISEAIFGGILTVLEFLPSVVMTIAYLTLLEESGIASRLAVILSPLTKIIGISCRSAISFFLGFGCTVPAVKSLRAVDKQSARKASLVLPFFQCSAKIPIFSLFASVFFKKISIFSLIIIYLGGIIFALILGRVAKFFNKVQNLDAIVELPRYRMPTFKVIFRNSFDKCSDLIKKISTVLLILSSFIWILSHIDNSLGFTESLQYDKSLLYFAGSFISPIFKPLGINEPVITAALVSGLFAKEGTLTALSVCAGKDGLKFILPKLFTCQSAASFLCFYSLYPPCASAFIAVAHEFGIAHAVKCSMIQLIFAYSASLIIYNLLGLII